MKRLTHGITRTVFLVGRLAIKVPCGRYGWAKWLAGLLANLQEREWGKRDYPELCPVLFADPLGLVVIMPRLPTRIFAFSDVEFDERFQRGCEERNGYRIPVENKADSFGILQGRIVAIDYGT